MSTPCDTVTFQSLIDAWEGIIAETGELLSRFVIRGTADIVELNFFVLKGKNCFVYICSFESSFRVNDTSVNTDFGVSASMFNLV
jgi:hypothetical protein